MKERRKMPGLKAVDEIFSVMKCENVTQAIECVKQDKLQVIDSRNYKGSTVLQCVITT